MKSVLFVIALLFVTGGALALSSNALAQDEAENSLSTTVKDFSSRLIKNIGLDYFTFFHGPTIKDINSPYSTDNTGHLSKRAVNGFDGEFNVDYMFDRDNGIGIGPSIPFIYSNIHEKGFMIGDVGLKMIDRKTIDNGYFRLATNLYLQAPTSDYSQSVGMKYAVKTTPYVWYNIQGTHFKIGAWTEAKYYAQTLGGRDFKLYAAPYINYRLSDKFALNLEYEMEARHPIGAPATRFVGYQQDLQPGFVWFITRQMMLNPYLILMTNNIATNTTGMGAIFSATLL
jgi:hypothetical protein